MAVNRIKAPLVYTKALWAGTWELQPYLRCNMLTLTVSPNIDSAELQWRYGEIMREDDPAFLPYTPLALLGHYVRVAWEQDAPGTMREWVGIITSETDTQEGTNAVDVSTGSQGFTAMGMEWLLGRDLLSKSIVKTMAGGEATVERVLDFNAGGSTGNSVEIRGNKDPGSQYFAADLGDATEWDARQICEYLLTNFGPRDQNDNHKIIFTIPLFQSLSLQQIITQVPAQRRSVKQIIDALISPYRGFGYTVEVTITGAVSLSIFTWTASDISLPGGGTLYGNTTQHNLDLQSDLLVRQPTIIYDANSKYDQVVARGERATATGTFAYQNGLDRSWEDADEATYTTAASGETDYDTTDLDQQMQWDVSFRSSDAMRKVFSYLVVPDDWDGKLFGFPIDPELKPLWRPGLRFLPYTTLLEYHDYSYGKIASETTGDDVPDGVIPQPRLPFGSIADVDTRYYYLDQLSQQGDFTDTAGTDGRSWSAVVRPLEEMPGLALQAIGAPQYVFAKDDFTADHGADEQNDFQPELSWKNAKFTATLQLDHHCEAKYPANISGLRDYANVRVITVPNHRLDYVVPQTVVGIDEEGALQESEGGYIQDDRTKLADIARLAYQWYQQPRVAVNYTVNTTRVSLSPGEMIATLTTGGSAYAVNTVITRMMFNFQAGTTSVATGFGELDVEGFA